MRLSFGRLGVTIIAIAGSLLFPRFTYAQQGLVPDCRYGEAGCDNPYAPENYGICELVQLFNNVLEFMIGLSAIIISLVIVYAGFTFVMSRGNPTTLQRAKSMFSNAVIGFVIVLVAFLLVNTILKVFIGGENNDILSWQVVDCAYSRDTPDPLAFQVSLQQNEFIAAEYEGAVYGAGGIVLNYRPPTSAGGGGYSGRGSYGYGGTGGATAGGSCSELSVGPCAVSNLEQYFPGNAAAASRVCNMESGGTPIWSSTDLCKDGASFSGGYFQINIIAHANNIPGCSGAIQVNSGGSPQGQCLDRRVNSKGVAYCGVWDCQVANPALYEQCRQNVVDSSFNLQYASELYRRSGNDFTDWSISAGRCNAPR